MPVPARAAAAGLLLALAACSTAAPSSSTSPRSAPAPAGSPSAGSPSAGSPSVPSPSLSPSRSGTPRPAGDGVLTLAFAGDVHFANQLAPLLQRPDSALAELRPTLGRADLAVVNLETALTSRGAPAPKTWHFRSPPAALDVLAGAGVDVVSLANNHAVDYGPVGLRDTLAARRDSPLPVVGIGKDAEEAFSPAVVEVEGRRVAVLAATQVPDWTAFNAAAGAATPGVAVALDPTRLARAVRDARGKADVVVVYLHWGTDYTSCPDASQRSTSRLLADAGADVVVGTHAHQLQGAGWLGRTYVSYGLGNFVWWRRNSATQAATGVLTLTLQGRRVVEEDWVPLAIEEDGIPRRPGREQAQVQLADRERVRQCSGLAAAAP